MLGLAHGAAALAAGVALFVSSVSAQMDPIIIQGNHLFYKTNGSEFYIKGVAYQQDVGGNSSSTDTGNTNFVDPLTDHAGCDRDVPLLQKLNTNTIRVYAIDTTQDHSYCMNLLQQNDIYLIADLSAPNISINRDQPQWNMELYDRYTSVIDTLANYTNVIGFFAGNEVANNASNVDSIAFVKAAARDMKAYIKAKNYRQMYVGYASDDDSTIRVDLENYLNCGPTTDDNVDFFGYNIYSWCDPSDFVTSGYQARTQELANYSIPAFFAEYGCNTNEPRDFGETAALFSDNMTDVWSGGIVYEYFQETNSYGLVSVEGSSATPLPDYTNYQSAIASVSPTILNTASFTPTATALRSCPAVGSTWDASPTLPPTPNQALCDCMVQDLACVVKGTPSDATVGDLFNYICGSGQGSAGVDCSGISGNGTSGAYGAYSMCDQNSRLSWAFNAYYQQQKAQNNANNDACDFKGNATTQSAKASGTCASLVSQAGGAAGTGTSTATPGAAQGSAGSGTSGGSGSGSTSKSSAIGMTVPALDTGLIKMGLYIVVAVLAGAGVVLM